MLAAPGHKGLLGPLGTGVLYIRPGVERELEPLRYGGTGTHSDEDRQPDELPDKYEPGNHNLLGLAGLAAAVRLPRSERPIAAIHAHHTELTARLLERLHEIDGVTIHGPQIDRESHERREHHGRRLRSAGTGRRARSVAPHPMPRRPALRPADARSTRHHRRRRHAAPQPRLRDHASTRSTPSSPRLKKSPACR